MRNIISDNNNESKRRVGGLGLKVYQDAPVYIMPAVPRPCGERVLAIHLSKDSSSAGANLLFQDRSMFYMPITDSYAKRALTNEEYACLRNSVETGIHLSAEIIRKLRPKK